MERSSAPLVKDYTVRFLSCLIHCVLNYSQSIAKEGPFIQYRDERLGYTYNSGARKGFEAIDDGGVQLEWPRNKRQVALPEAKRSFQDITNGRPTVSDKLLGQIVGEALASKLFKDCNISTENVVSIVAVKYYIKFFHFNITEGFVHRFETLLPTDENSDMAAYLQVHSTHWFDMREHTGRKYFVRHILGLVEWADASIIETNMVG
ncbi:hypothetical protein GX50_06304 [[Emmonsia] crescens]|uniref:Uncharacterized protein n=1 Tax=[Emmonsia] crescens TaxID=73230 RepID=A0A2B7ZDP8_9EURO|nr:hypothetical protein GX50_06304 [Emmonsia crescens]